jgi:hypothetical protein
MRPQKGGSQCFKTSLFSSYRAGVFVFVLAQRIQDMSAVTNKTVGIRLPRLRCGAIWLKVKREKALLSGLQTQP